MYNNYLSYLPAFMQQIEEIKEISKAVDIQVKALSDWRDYIAKEGIILTASDTGLLMWENLLRLSHSGSVELRRNRIISELTGILPYTFNNIQMLFNLIFGGNSVNLQYGDTPYTLKVLFNVPAIRHIPLAEKILKKVLPANIFYSCVPIYNTHRALAQHRHSKLAAYTHNQLRKAVIS